MPRLHGRNSTATNFDLLRYRIAQEANHGRDTRDNKPDFRNGFPIRDLRDGSMISGQADGAELVLAVQRILRLHPSSKTTMEVMIHEAQSDQSIYIEQIDLGKFATISSTSLLLMVGAFGPALKAGSPVTGSVTIFIRCGRFLRGVSTIRRSSIFASGGSPGRISSRRRSGRRTTCPLVDTLACMVRRSYFCASLWQMKLHLPSRSLPDGHLRLADCFSAVVLLQTDRLIGRSAAGGTSRLQSPLISMTCRQPARTNLRLFFTPILPVISEAVRAWSMGTARTWSDSLR
jgi:hypothetical protein